MSKSNKTPLLEFKGVYRQFSQAGEKIDALKKTNLALYPGEFAAVIGPSGSGKSTFLTIAGGLQSPSGGSVIIDGINVAKLSKKELSAMRLHEIGFILQASNLVPYLTVEEQLELIDRVLKRKNQQSARESILKALDILRLKNKYPSDLSGGERQRAAIAKVLHGNSNIILADEPTASLDTRRAIEVVSLLADETRSRGKTTVMVTHDERLIAYCDTVYEMHDGTLVRRKGHKRTK